MFFKGTVIGSKHPYSVKDTNLNETYPNCQIGAMGATSWKPQDGDYVFCDVDENDFCLIICRIETESDTAPSTGVQIGDNENGIQVSEDGQVITIKADVNLVRYTQEGVFVDYEALEEKGNGYLRTVKQADKDGAANMATEVYEHLRAPAQDKMAYRTVVRGTGTVVGSVERTTSMGTEGSLNYEELLDSDGNFNVKKFKKWMFGDGAAEPMILGLKWATFENAKHAWHKDHIHSTPSGPSGKALANGQPYEAAVPTSDIDGCKSTKVMAKE